jgi:zinc/manganese transport system substrate-binding protein
MVVRLGVLAVTLAALAAILVFGTRLLQSSAATPQSRADRPRVVATFSILADVVANVAGEHVDLYTLVGRDGDVHTFEPTPADGRRLSDAVLVFENGLYYEAWLDSLYRATGSSARRVAVTDGLPVLHADEDEHEDEDSHADEDEQEDGHGHSDDDPHMWQDVARVIHMTTLIRDALAEVDPARAESYRANAAAYIAQLQALDSWILESVALIPEQRRKIVTPHNTFAYFADRYGFQVAGTALSSSSTEAQPSAGHMAALVEEIRHQAVPVIFPENLGNQQLMQRLAAEAGVALGPPLYTDALGLPGSGADSYLDLMRHNVSALVSHLGRQ